MDAVIPKSLYITIRNYSEIYALRKKWGALHYYRFAVMNGKNLIESKKIAPSGEQWMAFWDRVNDIGIWQWKPYYPNPGVLDGDKWEIDIAVGKQRISSQGEGNYPKQNYSLSQNELGRSKTFLDFITAVRDLIGGLPFS